MNYDTIAEHQLLKICRACDTIFCFSLCYSKEKKISICLCIFFFCCSSTIFCFCWRKAENGSKGDSIRLFVERVYNRNQFNVSVEVDLPWQTSDIGDNEWHIILYLLWIISKLNPNSILACHVKCFFYFLFESFHLHIYHQHVCRFVITGCSATCKCTQILCDRIKFSYLTDKMNSRSSGKFCTALWAQRAQKSNQQ